MPAVSLGTVIAIQANFYRVQLQAPEPTEALGRTTAASNNSNNGPTIVLCTRRARLKKMGARVLVGDRVRVEAIERATGRGIITAIYPRQTELDRPPVANADRILLVFALAEPTLDPIQLSRFLLKAEQTRIPICLCLNKCDLVSAATQQAWKERLAAWGYDPIFTSIAASTGLDRLLEQLSGRTTIVAGPSGVGKSSTINWLIPAARLRVGAVSGKLGRGRHTTRHVELFELPGGGLLADTPGFNQPDLNLGPRELPALFPEIRSRLQARSCQFGDCQHRSEPNCAVRGTWERYEYYLQLLAELAASEERSTGRETEPNVKLK
ncbi:MAG: ribosome small subunit-dependent GTPase A, partial [Cyanobacteria bacterium J06641_5]